MLRIATNASFTEAQHNRATAGRACPAHTAVKSAGTGSIGGGDNESRNVHISQPFAAQEIAGDAPCECQQHRFREWIGPFVLLLPYSYRSAFSGLTRDARCAGR